MPNSKQKAGQQNVPKKTSGPSKKEYEQAFEELAALLFKQYKSKKQADQLDELLLDVGQIDEDVS